MSGRLANRKLLVSMSFLMKSSVATITFTISAVVWMGSISIIAQSSTNALGLGVGTLLGSQVQLRQPGVFSLTTFASHRTRHPDGRSIFEELVSDSDVVIENFR